MGYRQGASKAHLVLPRPQNKRSGVQVLQLMAFTLSDAVFPNSKDDLFSHGIDAPQRKCVSTYSEDSNNQKKGSIDLQQCRKRRHRMAC